MDTVSLLATALAALMYSSPLGCMVLRTTYTFEDLDPLCYWQLTEWNERRQTLMRIPSWFWKIEGKTGRGHKLIAVILLSYPQYSHWTGVGARGWGYEKRFSVEKVVGKGVMSPKLLQFLYFKNLASELQETFMEWKNIAVEPRTGVTKWAWSRPTPKSYS